MSIRFGLLGLLSRGPAHGYQLRAELEAVTGGSGALNIGQVYSTLQRLERDGLVEAEDGPEAAADDRHRYHLSKDGTRALEDWFATPVPARAPLRSELVVKVVLAATLPDVDLRTVLDAQRAETMQTLQHLTRAKAAGVDKLSALVADASIFQVEAQVRWLDHCETRLLGSGKGVSS
jgi:DNA-binding PadR family transcriptional regulator